jgi:hypothetical protein
MTMEGALWIEDLTSRLKQPLYRHPWDDLSSARQWHRAAWLVDAGASWMFSCHDTLHTQRYTFSTPAKDITYISELA